MVYVFIEGANAFAVDHEGAQGFVIVSCLDGLAPNPEAFGTRVDRGANSEAVVSLVENHSVEQETFASSVLASHGDDTNLALNGPQKSFCLFADHVFFYFSIEVSLMNSV